ncbi:hypothetical protein [Sphingomonas sp. Leaf62]|uniref:hypothetical protein n=1 Tax=Sphingomonas sp. Leaf62 TaxID=1736228 RepID=UPI0012E32753|nr:hypothetical protein [Sphingomonas sp. Leaf62]
MLDAKYRASVLKPHAPKLSLKVVRVDAVTVEERLCELATLAKTVDADAVVRHHAASAI